MRIALNEGSPCPRVLERVPVAIRADRERVVWATTTVDMRCSVWAARRGEVCLTSQQYHGLLDSWTCMLRTRESSQ